MSSAFGCVAPVSSSGVRMVSQYISVRRGSGCVWCARPVAHWGRDASPSRLPPRGHRAAHPETRAEDEPECRENTETEYGRTETGAPRMRTDAVACAECEKMPRTMNHVHDLGSRRDVMSLDSRSSHRPQAQSRLPQPTPTATQSHVIVPTHARVAAGSTPPHTPVAT